MNEKEIDTGRLAGLSINDNGFAFDSRSGESFSVNHTGRRVIRRLVAGYDLEQITRELADGFLVDSTSIQRDLRDFLEQLRALQLAKGVR